jgi:CheY-like chemotaxis protein
LSRAGQQPDAIAISARHDNEGTFVPQFKKILIVDDEEVHAENLQAYFQRCGWDVRIGGTGKAAVIAATEFRPGMILLDDDLPDMTGFEALEAIRVAHCCSCILMSGDPVHTVLARANQLGMAHILVKPFSMAELESQMWTRASAFCIRCFESRQRPSLSDCGDFLPPTNPTGLGNPHNPVRG